MNRIFQKHNGDSGGRKIFTFNLDNYKKINRQNVPNEIVTVIELNKALPNSHINTWCVKLLFDGHVVSYCNALMVGKGKAEIDIRADEDFRGKGYATLAATLLIDKLLENNLTPTRSTWPFSVESQYISQKLGFVAQPDAKAWIWMEDM